MGKFIINKRKNGEYQFNLKAANGQIILSSQGYNAKASCINGVTSVKTNAPIDHRYERKVAKDGSRYFNLKAANGEIIGTSEMYSSTSAREGGIESVKKNAPDALIIDETI
jgi:uncharacterized protein YegP (UPF0339 family)